MLYVHHLMLQIRAVVHLLLFNTFMWCPTFLLEQNLSGYVVKIYTSHSIVTHASKPFKAACENTSIMLYRFRACICAANLLCRC